MFHQNNFLKKKRHLVKNIPLKELQKFRVKYKKINLIVIFAFK